MSPTFEAPYITKTCVTYGVEKWEDCWRDISSLWSAHWEELALNKDIIKLNVNIERYIQLSKSGHLHVVVARDGGKAIGYHISMIDYHLHYADTLMAVTDVYYIAKGYRRGTTGIKLFREVERTLAKRGVKKFFIQTKVHDDLDHSRIFEYLKYRHVEKLYAKTLGG